MILLLFSRSPRETRIFNRITQDYCDVYGVYPRVLDELPEFLTVLGYPCIGYTDYANNNRGRGTTIVRAGLKFENDADATAFMLRFGS